MTGVEAPYTDEQYAEYLKSDKDKVCLVCKTDLIFRWTDLHGQGRCIHCGVSYGLIPTYPNESLLERLGLIKADVKLPYCDLYQVVPLYRAFWEDCHRTIHAGSYMGGSPDKPEDVDAFVEWMKANAPTLRPLYEKQWDWDWFEKGE